MFSLLPPAGNQSPEAAFLRLMEESAMLRRALISLGLLVLVLSACEPPRLMAPPSSDYEIDALVAQ